MYVYMTYTLNGTTIITNERNSNYHIFIWLPDYMILYIPNHSTTITEN